MIKPSNPPLSKEKVRNLTFDNMASYRSSKQFPIITAIMPIIKDQNDILVSEIYGLAELTLKKASIVEPEKLTVLSSLNFLN